MQSFSFGEFQQVCQIHGLNPQRTSLHAAERIHRGLDPDKTTSHALDCIRHGLDPGKTSVVELENYKKDLD